MIYSRIAGTGSYLPDKVVTNADLEKIVDTTDEWIRERSGIHQRHVAADDETTCDLAEHAARRAIEAAGVEAGSIDLIVLATTTPDLVFPSTACLLQERLGIHDCAAFDIQAVCTGFVYALSVADKFVRTGAARCALVVGAETFTRIIDWSDRKTCVLFGDGAGAVIVEAADAPGVLSTHLHADGRYADLLLVPAGVSKDYQKLRGHGAFVRMEGNQLFKVAVNTLSGIVEEALTANGIGIDAVDWLIPHQANKRIIAATARKLGLSDERIIVTVAEHGNTSAASIPLALDVAVRDGRVKRGQLLLLEAFGGGLTWGAALVRY
ncbi:MAG: ketoacyl-ACP synthase III [Gammaproteobacteria bacterium]|nr:ketoacyl-ACP synthase III [Gammaproteobacteria bacterium]